MKDIRLIIFDLDGTLIDAFSAIYRSVNFTLRQTGYPRQDQRRIRKAVGWGDKNLLKPFVKRKDLERAVAVYRRHHAASLLSGARLFPGTRGILKKLKKTGYKLAVASNRPTEFSLLLLRLFAIRGFFAAVLCADKVKKGKPAPDILLAIMAKLRVNPAETVYVGDMFIDIRAAKRAGCRAVAVSTGSSERKELLREKPAAILPGLSRLPRLLTAELT